MTEPDSDAVLPTPAGHLTTRRSRWRAAVGLLWVVVSGFILVTKGSTMLAGHPAYPVLVVVTLLVGVALLASGLARSTSRGRGSGVGRVIGRVLGGVGTILLLGALIYLIPLSATSPETAMQSTSTVTVDSSPTRITLTPVGVDLRAGLIFQPGAKVDPRAYVALLKPVAAAGNLVVIVKQPLNIGFLAIGDPGHVIAANPSITKWAVAGHSLGGVAAGSYAGQQDSGVQGLMFWASYPLGSLADHTALTVSSVSGTNDALSTPADIEASRPNLPPGTVFVPIQGGVHAFFGDYGEQPGDGTPTVSREVAQQQVVQASIDFMAKVAAS